MRAARAAVGVLLVLAVAAAPAGAQTSGAKAADPNALVAAKSLTKRPPGRRLTGAQAQALADAVPRIVRERRRFKGSYPGVFMKGASGWQVSYYSRDKPPREIGQVTIDDHSAAVTESYVGYKVAWTMARGYSGAFGRKVNSPYIWIGLSALFLAAFVDPRRPFRLLHLDLLVLVGFGASVAYFNDAQVDVSVPLVYPGLVYLLGRMGWIGLRTGPDRDRPEPLKLLVPATWLAVGVVFLLGFRIGLNVTNSNVIDVGYSGVLGADRLTDGRPLYGSFPRQDEHGDTYGPVNYATYVPFVQALGWSGRWDDLPAAHAAAIVFDLLSVLGLFMIGRRIRGPDLGWALAYAWCAFPFTLYVLSCNSNDALVSAFVLLALIVAAWPARRGAVVALGGLTKWATLALAPLFALHGRPGPRAVVAFGLAFVACVALGMSPVVAHGQGLSMVYDRTLGFQAQRGSPFSVWGLYDLEGAQRAWQVLAVGFALAVAVLPRRRDLVGLAACAAAVLIALQLGATYWFYLYLVWFFPLVMIALLGRFAAPAAAPLPVLR